MIKNINRLMLTPDMEEALVMTAQTHKRFSRIIFEVMDVSDDTLLIRVRQGKNPHENYATPERLIEVGKETFSPYTTKKIQVHPFPYIASPVEVVSPEWINLQMNKLKIKLKDIVLDTGVEKAELSAMINKHRPLSQRSKAMFYYYFQAKLKFSSENNYSEQTKIVTK